MDTIEHFPELHEYHVDQGGAAKPVLPRVIADGVAHRFTSLVFQCVERMALEMRVFARRALLAELRAADFGYVRVVRRGNSEHGVHWLTLWSLPMLASPPGPSRAARRSRAPVPREAEDHQHDLDKPVSDESESASDASPGRRRSV